MSTDNTEPNWTARFIALFAVVVALVGGLWLFNKANRDTTPPIAVATSCRGFQADAGKLFDKGDAVALSGTFAPGDRVRLAIDFEGVSYSWELTGVLAKAKKAEVTGAGSSSIRSISFSTSTTSVTSDVARGRINGTARLDVEVDVAMAGDGAITIKKNRQDAVARNAEGRERELEHTEEGTPAAARIAVTA